MAGMLTAAAALWLAGAAAMALGAVRGAMRTLTREEAAALLEQLAGSDNFSYSPSGKAIFAEIPPEDIRTRLG